MNESFIELAGKLLCPPGNGVYTVNTAKERKVELHTAQFNQIEENAVIQCHKNILLEIEEKLKNNSLKPCIIGLASDSGGGIQRGANWGPLFIRLELERLWKSKIPYSRFADDLGDIRVIPHYLHDKYLSQSSIFEARKALYLNPHENLPVSPLSMAMTWLDFIYERFPHTKILGLGGDHSVSYAFVRSYLMKQKRLNVKTGILHFDAHTDLLEKRLGVDICFGSWAYYARNWCHTTEAVVQVGIRSSGKNKEHWEKSLGVKQFWGHEIKEIGLDNLAKKICLHYKSIGVSELYISLDIDALDSKIANATGTPEKDGMQPYEIAYLVEYLANHFRISGADLVEVAPFVKIDDLPGNVRETTLNVAGLLAHKLIELLNRS